MKKIKLYKEKIINNKKLFAVMLMLVSGILIVGLSDSMPKESSYNSDEKKYVDISVDTEEKLKKLLMSIDGVEKAEVMICFSDMGIKEYYKDETEDVDTERSKTDKKIVFKRYEGNEVPILKREVNPEVKGVTVIADCTKKGLYDVIYKAVRTSLGADSHKIEIIINDRSKK